MSAIDKVRAIRYDDTNAEARDVLAAVVKILQEDPYQVWGEIAVSRARLLAREVGDLLNTIEGEKPSDPLVWGWHKVLDPLAEVLEKLPPSPPWTFRVSDLCPKTGCGHPMSDHQAAFPMGVHDVGIVCPACGEKSRFGGTARVCFVILAGEDELRILDALPRPVTP
jgi:hypothetical protein